MTPLPSNEDLEAYSSAVPWQLIEQQKEQFNQILQNDTFSLEAVAEAIGAPVTTYSDIEQPDIGNAILAQHDDHNYILGGIVSKRYRSGKSFVQSIVPYNLNPSVNHTNIHETDDSTTHIRALGAELELGLLRPDGSAPTEDEMHQYITTYQFHAQRLGITPQIDREACQYQIEAHIAPGIGYHRTRSSLDGIMTSLVASSEATGLQTAIMSAYPVESDFQISDDPKVQTAVDLMVELNAQFPESVQQLEAIKARYHMNAAATVVHAFRLQGCHLHLDLAGRSEALGLLTFHTMLRSATAIANSAVLKGGPFVNGFCDDELLCVREYLRGCTVTGRHIEVPRSPHLREGDLARYADLLQSERTNAMARALLFEDGLGTPISVMHNPIGRVRPDLRTSKRICTVESTGMPVNISASRQAAVLTDFEFTHALIEQYFRKYGCNLNPMREDETLWALVGPLNSVVYIEMQDRSDRECSDAILKTAAGTEMSLAEFYEMKRVYMHKHLADAVEIAPRDIDDVYTSLQRMLAPPSGREAQTIEQYIYDHRLRSTGNWGRILQNGFVEEGGVPGTHNPDAVLKVVNRVHNALRKRYLQ